jgi:CRISPR-associated protein Csc2
MRNPYTGEASTSINESEYVKPESHFLDIEVLKDVTADELVYTCGNILRSSRYGAISSRIGKVQNSILALVFSRAEIFSSLELTQATYQRLSNKEHPLQTSEIISSLTGEKGDLTDLLSETIGGYQVLVGQQLGEFLAEVKKTYEAPEAFLQRLDGSYPTPAKAKKSR